VGVLNKLNASNVLRCARSRTQKQPSGSRLGATSSPGETARIFDAVNLNFAIRCDSRSRKTSPPFNSNLTQSLSKPPAAVKDERRPGTRNNGRNHELFDEVLQAVDALVQQNLGNLRWNGSKTCSVPFATILVVWYGIKAALAAGDHRGGFHFANFVTLILMISFGLRDGELLRCRRSRLCATSTT